MTGRSAVRAPEPPPPVLAIAIDIHPGSAPTACGAAA
jgi:hypothetical protein